MLDQEASENRVVDNIILNNGGNADPDNPFSVYASDVALLTAGDHKNCFTDNQLDSSVSLIGELPECVEEEP